MKVTAKYRSSSFALPSNNVAITDTAIRGAVIQTVNLVDLIERNKSHKFSNVVSLPGHLIQFVLSGEVEHITGGIKERFVTGDIVWYHDNEILDGKVIRGPWRFITVNFDAPTLAPPPVGKRIRKVNKQTAALFMKLLKTWKDNTINPVRRHLLIHSILNEIIVYILPDKSGQKQADESTKLWWIIENHLRHDLSRHVKLSFLRQYTHLSLRSIIRSCKSATGLSPMKRLKKIRLSYARGLVQFSTKTITEIAYMIGYGRVQEFSRDYIREHHHTPTEDRQAGPDYRLARTVEKMNFIDK